MTDRNRRPDATGNQDLWDLLARDEAPELATSVWPAVRNRTLARRDTSWRPRLAYGFSGAACAAVGLWLGLSLGGAVEGPGSYAMDTLVEGSLLDETDWSIAGLYWAIESTDNNGTRP